MHTMHTTPPDTSAVEPAHHYHVVIWLDHHEARIIHFGGHGAGEETVRPHDAPRHLHIKAGSAAGQHVQAEPGFFREVAQACAQSQQILLTGPSTAKTEFMTYLTEHMPPIAARIAGVVPLGRLTDPQLLAEGRTFFVKADRMTPQT